MHLSHTLCNIKHIFLFVLMLLDYMQVLIKILFTYLVQGTQDLNPTPDSISLTFYRKILTQIFFSKLKEK